MHIELGTREEETILAIDDALNFEEMTTLLRIINTRDKDDTHLAPSLTYDSFLLHIGDAHTELCIYQGETELGMRFAFQAARKIVAVYGKVGVPVSINPTLKNVQEKNFFSD